MEWSIERIFVLLVLVLLLVSVVIGPGMIDVGTTRTVLSVCLTLCVCMQLFLGGLLFLVTVFYLISLLLSV